MYDLLEHSSDFTVAKLPRLGVMIVNGQTSPDGMKRFGELGLHIMKSNHETVFLTIFGPDVIPPSSEARKIANTSMKALENAGAKANAQVFRVVGLKSAVFRGVTTAMNMVAAIPSKHFLDLHKCLTWLSGYLEVPLPEDYVDEVEELYQFALSTPL